MTGTGSDIEWYLARDGKQYGPLSDTEMAKLVELGHLRPNDLVWKAGFPDWQAAGNVFAPPPPKPAPPPRQPAPPPGLGAGRTAPAGGPAAGPHDNPQRNPGPSGDPRSHGQPMPAGPRPAGAHPHAPGPVAQKPVRRPADGPAREPMAGARERSSEAPARRRRGIGRVVTFLVVTMLIGGGALAAYKYRDTLQNLALAASTKPSPAATAPPLKGFSDNADTLDGKLQKAPLWQLLRREFPEWYQERLKETTRLTAEGKPEDAVAKSLADALVALRRKNADHALAASLPRLKAIAETFHANLVRLGNFNKVACFAFISQSEAHPIVVDLMQKPEHSAPVQAQLTAVFDAIGEGRRVPQKHLPPRKADYDEVTKILTQKGWKESDLELFSDSTELAKAPPAAVCKLVTDWFEAHLAIKNDEALTRLLVEAVRPVVGG